MLCETSATTFSRPIILTAHTLIPYVRTETHTHTLHRHNAHVRMRAGPALSASHQQVLGNSFITVSLFGKDTVETKVNEEWVWSQKAGYPESIGVKLRKIANN